MEKSLNKKSVLILLLISIVLLLSGCGYHLIKYNMEKKVFISPFENYSLQPQVEVYTLGKLYEIMLSYPGFAPVKNKENADIVLKGKIKRIERPPVFFSTEKTNEIVMARFSVEIEIAIYKGKKLVSKDLIKESIAVELLNDFKEEEMLEKLGTQIAKKVFFLLVKKHEQGII